MAWYISKLYILGKEEGIKKEKKTNWMNRISMGV
jgi:hypothetical protein